MKKTLETLQHHHSWALSRGEADKAQDLVPEIDRITTEIENLQNTTRSL
tara:strand:- start:3359 stop:3505 length:147 start_codon:yes stop_codon:yes gene_type:complete